MFSRVRNYFKGSAFARMSSGEYCIIRDLGLIKGGKGMRHHEVVLRLSWSGFAQAIRSVLRRKFKHRDMTSENLLRQSSLSAETNR
jgi:hypothetical protein